MTNFINLINQTADKFEQLIQNNTTLLTEIPTEDFGWTNNRWYSQQFRLAHVERFQQPKFSVLHTVIFPHLTDPSPIFGFDIIASDTKATGLFFDFSPTVESYGIISSHLWSEPRERPEWGTILSEHWIACRPTYTEAETISTLACTLLEQYLSQLGTKTTTDVPMVIKKQNQYSLNQRQNTHTTRVLMKILGEERGQYFVENILFPTI
jgi:phycocyanobilin:ferredoxin oxidoreductase